MADVIGQEERINRICYVEPNDVFDSIDGIPVTPPYEDFSIAFDLIVKVASRFRSNEVRGNSGQVDDKGNYQWVISWTSAPKQGTPSWVTFMSGNDVGNGTNSLTTSYTDISFDHYFEGEEIEGLGVEQVNVSFESWYTPTVSIKFVDTRGSAFFGREEAIHYNDKLTADNVFGCFATIPYPEFKLQIKGFLGKPVTYQLACSNFKAELNSQTGNFEFTVSFIGYSYALLTDIPLDYLIAAPLNPYVGVEYWDKHKSDPKWQMLGEDGKPDKEPVRLNYFFDMIENAQSKYNEKQSAISDGTNSDLSAVQQEKTLLNNILNNFNVFYQSLLKDVNNYYIDTTNEADKKRQIIIFSDKENIKLINASGTYKSFVEAVKTYNDAFSSTMIGKEKMPNGWDIDCPLDIKGVDTFSKSQNTFWFNQLKGKRPTVTNVKQLKFNDGRTLTDSSVQQIIKYVGEQNKTILHRYMYIIDCGTLITDISTNVENLEASKTRMEKEITQSIDEDITSILPFKPYIGNVFKLLFCHLETFCHIMYEASKDIQSEALNGLRSPSVLGINNVQSQTDLFVNSGDNKEVTVPAWVGIINSKATTTDGENVTIEDDAETFGWPGDLKGDFVEEKVVYGFEMAIQSIEESNESQKGESTELNSFPITTCDFNNNGNVFKGAGEASLSELSGYLSIRAAQLFGVMTKNMQNDIPTVKLLGNIDAYNYYNALGSIGLIQGNILNKAGNDDISNIIVGISECDPNYDKYGILSTNTEKERHKFETVLKVNGVNNDRHPFFKDGKWVHYYDKKGVSLIPSKFRNYNDYQRDYVYDVDGGKPYFVPTYQKNNYDVDVMQNTLYPSDTVRLNKKSASLDMFNIFTDGDYVNSIVNRYVKLNEGSVKVINYDITDNSGLKTFTEKYWKVSDERYSKFFNVKNMLSANLGTIGINDDDLFKTELSSDSANPTLKNENTRKKLPDFDGWYSTTKHKNSVECKPDGTWTVTTNSGSNTVSTDELVIQDLKQYFYENNSIKFNVNIFGSPFYYLQDEKIKNKDTQRNVKALLFLHTFKYNYANILNVFSKNKVSGCIECVPYGYLLLLGGLLWRKRQPKDPIVYNDGYKNYCPCGKEYALFTKLNGEYYFTVGNNNATTAHMYNVTLSSLLGGNSSIDYNIEEQLVEMFLNFSKDDFGTIKNSCEISNWYIPAGKKNKLVQRYTPATLCKDAEIYWNIWNGKPVGQEKKIYTLKERMTWIRNNGICMNNGSVVRYRMFAVENGKNTQGIYGFKMLFNEDDKDMQSKLKDIYLRKCLVSDSCARVMGNNSKTSSNDVVTVDRNVFKAYVKGFTDKLKEIVDSTSKVMTTDSNLSPTQNDRLNYNRNLCVAIYYYLKNVWDRWLVGKAENTYDVSTFFDNDFIFMDSFYRNTYYRLPLNCQKVIDAYKGAAKDKSLYSFIGDLCKDHDCWFMAVPDFIHFTGEDTTDGHNKEGMYSDIETMKEVFRPMPYNKIPAPQNNNKFVIIYIHKLSEVPSNVNNFRYDSFDIWSHTDGFNVAPPIFKSDRLLENSDDTITRLGYKVPSFGVSFARQNQHLFKNIKVDMNNPVQTEQAIKVWHNLISVGKSHERKITFTGQDVFNVYTNYSYECEVEMLGNAQICPLMYFQLLNVPMWRGTYMIYKVTHSMTPGNMTTTFRGMKLCRFPKPFSTSFFVSKPAGDTRNNEYNSGDYSNNSGGTYFTEEYKKATTWRKDWYHDKETGNAKPIVGLGIDSKNGIKRNDKLVSLFNRLYEEIASLSENQPKMKWNIVLSHVLRNKNKKTKNPSSAHCSGNAMDITIAYYNKNGKCITPVPDTNTPRPEIAQVTDILAKLHLDEVDQVIMEYKTHEDMSPGKYDEYNVLHVGVLSNEGTVRHQFWIGAVGGKHGYTFIDRYYPNDFLKKVNPKFDETAGYIYRSDRTNFKNRFINYSKYSMDVLDKHFGKGNSTAFNRWMEWTIQLEGGEKPTAATPHGYGIQNNAWTDYHNATGRNDYNYKNYYKWCWDEGKASQLKDPNIAIIYARGHFFISGVVTTNIIDSLNNMSPQQAFNKVMKLIGNYMLSADDGKKIARLKGWRRFLYNTKYGDYHNVYNDNNNPSVQEVKNYINSL